MRYNKFNAFLAELILFIDRLFPGFQRRGIIKKILRNCRKDWIQFRTTVVLERIDDQVEDIHAEWDAQEKSTKVYIEEEPDGSDAQKKLGGPMRITSSFYKRDSSS